MFSQAQLDQVLADHPTLNDFGMGSYATWVEGDGEFEKARDRLCRSLDDVNVAAGWIAEHKVEMSGGASVLRRWTVYRGSYGLKHALEKELNHYLTNGVFIAATILVGIPFYVKGPNIFFDFE